MSILSQVQKGGRRCLGAAGRRLCLLNAEELGRAARRRTGLEDFGTPPIEPALSILVESLERDAELHPLGRFLVRVHLRTILETRLRLTDYWKRQGWSLQSAPIERPIFIVGMPRSGSTFLHELLATDPDNRAPRVWEVMFPVPTQSKHDREKRIRKAAACLWWFRRLAPQADAVYPMRALTPHECVAIHSYTLLSQEFVSTCRVAGYEAFLNSADLSPAYLWQRRFLQHLQSQSPARQWVLKSPDHVHGMEQLFAVFPDAFIVHTHRNPLEVLKSSTELTRVLHNLFGWRRSREEIAARETRILAAGTEQAIRFRDEHPELANRFIDIKYAELTSNPLRVVREVYGKVERSLSESAFNRIQDVASKRSRYRGRGKSQHPTLVPGATRAAEVVFQRYCSRFNLSQ